MIRSDLVLFLILTRVSGRGPANSTSVSEGMITLSRRFGERL